MRSLAGLYLPVVLVLSTASMAKTPAACLASAVTRNVENLVMQANEPDWDAHHQRMDAETQKLNNGEPLPPVEPVWIERWWTLVSQIPREQREHTAMGLAAVTGSDSAAWQMAPEKQFALMVRSQLLDTLIASGALDDWMSDESKRKKVFAVAATIACDKFDLLGSLVPMEKLQPNDRQQARQLQSDFKDRFLHRLESSQ